MNAKDAKKLGAAIRRHREAAGLHRKGLADAAGIEPSTILRLETGVIREPRAETLQRIARVLGVAVEEFVSVAGYMSPNAEIGLPVYLRRSMGLTDDEAKRIERYIARLTNQRNAK
jgi:transcriptional regulator with XRE-family HTH domain